MVNRIKAIYLFVLVVSYGHMMHAAKPLDKKQLVGNIKKDLKDIHAVMAQLITFKDSILTDGLHGYEVPMLAELHKHTSEFLTNVQVIKMNLDLDVVQAEQPDNGLATAAGPIPAPGAHMLAQVKASGEVGAAKPLVVQTQFGEIGTATGNLMAKSPKFKICFEIGAKVKALADISADQKMIAAYVPIKRKMTLAEIGLLGQFENASQGRLATFTQYLKALIEGNNIPSFYKKFHVGSVVHNAYEATEAMGLDQLKPLHALFGTLVK